MPMPAISSPVSRLLAAEDPTRTVAFYRDVLGFEVREPRNDAGPAVAAELTRGPARILVTVGDQAPDSTGRSQPRGSAIIFLETNDVAGLQAEISGRGGNPSPLERANWLKVQFFEIRDPDGHTLWFGQSYHEPDRPDHVPGGRGQLRRMLPQLPLDDVAAGVAWYRDVLGFRINYQQDDLGVMDRDSVTLLLIARTRRHTGIGSFSVYINDADALYAELKSRDANVQGAPVSHPWGLRDFDVLDPEGNRITFAQTFE
jgi:catechol 2,3-dioxygenase-like lactoylglutathione lyase family enzyme